MSVWGDSVLKKGFLIRKSKRQKYSKTQKTKAKKKCFGNLKKNNKKNKDEQLGLYIKKLREIRLS